MGINSIGNKTNLLEEMLARDAEFDIISTEYDRAVAEAVKTHDAACDMAKDRFKHIIGLIVETTGDLDKITKLLHDETNETIKKAQSAYDTTMENEIKTCNTKIAELAKRYPNIGLEG